MSDAFADDTETQKNLSQTLVLMATEYEPSPATENASLKIVEAKLWLSLGRK